MSLKTKIIFALLVCSTILSLFWFIFDPGWESGIALLALLLSLIGQLPDDFDPKWADHSVASSSDTQSHFLKGVTLLAKRLKKRLRPFITILLPVAILIGFTPYHVSASIFHVTFEVENTKSRKIDQELIEEVTKYTLRIFFDKHYPFEPTPGVSRGSQLGSDPVVLEDVTTYDGLSYMIVKRNFEKQIVRLAWEYCLPFLFIWYFFMWMRYKKEQTVL